jgi:acyl-CoA reductase-like NAD-dependent aldehyde dehydrogenase
VERAATQAQQAAPLQLKDPSLFCGQAFVGGKWCDADDGQTANVTNPATGELLGTVPRMGAAETRRALEAPEVAQKAWRRKTAKERSAVLQKIAALMHANKDDLALIMTSEQGKPARRGGGRSRLRRVVHRMVRRRGAARLRRHDSGAAGRIAGSSPSRSRSVSARRSRRGISPPR